MQNLSLFEPEIPPFRLNLAQKLGELAREQVLIGTSSWKYEGWLGQIYTPERYMVRGRISLKRFEQMCLEEYGEVFPIVCGDFSFYQFPTADYWARLFATAPAALKFAFKVPEEVTVRLWPSHPRYGERGGTACLREHGVAHVFNAWTRMPELMIQIGIRDAWTAGFSVTRALLKFGRPYEQAVEKFQPYERVQEPNEKAREGLRQIVQKSRDEKRTAYIFVNNRLEGNAPGTIAAVLGVED